MTMINTTSKIRLYINNAEYTDYLIEGSLSDDSAYTTNIITTKGSIVLGGDTSIIDFNKTLFPIGSTVTIYATLSNGQLSKLPRGHLFVLNSTIDINERLTTLEVGCSLAFLSSREASYEDQIKTLIEDSLDSSFKESFLIEEYNLSTLDNLLKTAGKCIFQDKYGYVQDIDQFGDDGLGSNLSEAKLVSFDKYSAINIESLGGAIEELPSDVFVEVDIDVPADADDGDGDEEGIPEPFVTSVTSRTIQYTDIESEYLDIVNDPVNSDATTEAVPSCGTIEEPGSPETPKFAYTVTGSMTSLTEEKNEEVTAGSYTRYDGPGNQVDWEYSFEYCSALTYGSSIISTVVDKYVEFANSEIAKANGLLSKVNQYWATADDINSRSTEDKTQAQIDREAKQYEYYTCIGQQLYDAAKDIIGTGSFGANGLDNHAASFIDAYSGIYGISNITSTYYTYGEGDVLIEKVELGYIHIANSKAAQENTTSLEPSFRWNADLNGYRYQIITGIDFAGYKNYSGGRSSFAETIDGNSLPEGHDDQQFSDPQKYFNQILATKTTTNYSYGSQYTTETIYFEDYQEPSNNYTQINYSSSDSANAEESDRIEIARDVNGCIYSNEENAEDPVTISSTATITDTSGTVSAGWLGVPTATTKEISIPATFAPIAEKDCDGSITSPNVTATLANYESIVENFATNEAKRITGDNYGYRITEAGIRSEIFGYYPFYPISLILNSLDKEFKLRAASSSWVFDSSNVLCSFDCFLVADVAAIEGETELSPSDFTSTLVASTSSTTVLDAAFFNLPENAASITITALSSGVTFENSGTTLAVGDQVTVADITADNITATTDSSTSVVFISYMVTKTDSNVFSSLNDLFPPDAVIYVPNPFADGGEFTDNTTNGGSNADGGEFTTNTNGSGISLNAGDFDTGAEVLRPEPLPPSSATTANNSVDPEAVFGVELVDGSGTTVSSDTLSAPHGNVTPTLLLTLDFSIHVNIKLTLDAVVQPQTGWDYGHIVVSLGTDIDMGTVTAPNTYVANFGTVATANEPTLASGVA